MIHYKEDKYGFEYGAAKVQRVGSDPEKGWVVINIYANKRGGKQDGYSVYVTKTGKVRIYGPGSKEWGEKK